MNLSELKKSFAGLNIFEDRRDEENYQEVVFFVKDLEQWNTVLAGNLGAAAKPAKAKPDKQQLELTQSYGGIRENQTLFMKDFRDYILIAMLWPWSDGEHITLKLAKV